MKSTSASSSPAPRTPRTPRTPRPSRKTLGLRHKTDTQLRKFAIEAARLMEDLHCTDILLLDVSGLSQTTDLVIIATGTSDRQIRSVAQQVQEFGATKNVIRFGREADARATWVVVDFSEIVVHLFEPATRAHYDLEMMWGDASRIRWKRTAKKES